MLSFSISALMVIHVGVSLLIVFIVLMQRPKSEGLGAAFGGGMTENLFGAQTTNVLATITRWLGGLFFGLSLLLSVLYARQAMQPSFIQAAALRAAKAAATPAASPATATSPDGILSSTSAVLPAAASPASLSGSVSLLAPAATPVSPLAAPKLDGSAPAAH